MDNIIANFYKQYKPFLSRFGKIASPVKSQLLVTYCCSFYGVKLCNLKDIESVLVALRKCTRHIWNICPTTPSAILTHMTGICKHMLTKRFAKYYNNAMGSTMATFINSTTRSYQGLARSHLLLKVSCW